MASSPSIDFAEHKQVPYYELGKSLIRELAAHVTYQNPLLWNFMVGRHNKQADLEGKLLLDSYFTVLTWILSGPYYVTGSPDRAIEDGRAIMASVELLNSNDLGG